MKVEQNKSYFKLNNDINSKDKLIEYLKSLGLSLLEKRKESEDLFQRTFYFSDGNELEFGICWFKNISHVEFGIWNGSFISFMFDEIRGAITPYIAHDTYAFYYEGKQVAVFAIRNEEEDF